MIFYKVLLLILISATGCATQQKITIKSNPLGASIFVRTSDGESRDLGKTPFEIDSSKLFSIGSKVSLVTIGMDKFISQSILIVEGNGSENYDFQVKLDKEMEDPKANDIRNRQEKLAKSLAQANNFINQKRMEEARNVLLNLVKEFPHISVSYDLLGNGKFQDS